MNRLDDLLQYPGGDIVVQGLSDLRECRTTEEALLVSIAAPRLRGLGMVVPTLAPSTSSFEHALFEAIQHRVPLGAHSAYNALIGRIVSFAQALARG